jgi:hypothetical protein
VGSGNAVFRIPRLESEEAMDVRVKLSQIVEGMEFHVDEKTLFLDTNTGKIVLVTPDDMSAGDEDDPVEDYPDWQQEGVSAARSLVRGNDENLLELPGKWDVNEYKLMEDFCLSLAATPERSSLYAAIQGRGAFRRFKDTIQKIGVADDWYRYRMSQFKTVAIDWCQANEISYEDDIQA